MVALPLLHDTPAELAQAMDVKDWKRGECEPIPGKTMPVLKVVERSFADTYKKYTALGLYCLSRVIILKGLIGILKRIRAS